MTGERHLGQDRLLSPFNKFFPNSSHPTSHSVKLDDYFIEAFELLY